MNEVFHGFLSNRIAVFLVLLFLCIGSGCKGAAAIAAAPRGRSYASALWLHAHDFRVQSFLGLWDLFNNLLSDGLGTLTCARSMEAAPTTSSPASGSAGGRRSILMSMGSSYLIYLLIRSEINFHRCLPMEMPAPNNREFICEHEKLNIDVIKHAASPKHLAAGPLMTLSEEAWEDVCKQYLEHLLLSYYLLILAQPLNFELGTLQLVLRSSSSCMRLLAPIILESCAMKLSRVIFILLCARSASRVARRSVKQRAWTSATAASISSSQKRFIVLVSLLGLDFF